MAAEARILDANANRAREALRVLEDVARFALDDETLARETKSARHALREALGRLPDGWLAANRDVEGDVGRDSTAAREHDRRGLIDVAVAAGARVAEALRVLEETAKTIDTELARRIETLRYRAYELAAAIERRLGTGRARQWRVCLLLTEASCRRPWRDVLSGAIDAGCRCVQVREPELADGALLERVRDVVSMARPAGVTVIVNDRSDVALLAGADGVHLGQGDLEVGDVRRLAGRRLLVGVSTRNLEQAESAITAGADYVGLGAMFATPTKDTPPPVGPAYVGAFLERFPAMPHLAIGGITPENVARLAEAGAGGVAVCGAVCGADEPGAVVRTLRAALQDAPAPA